MRELEKVEVNVVSGGKQPDQTDHPMPILEPRLDPIPDFNPPVEPA